MYVHETKLRVRYGETDKMGYVYHGNYAQYYEIGRTELMRNFGLTYSEVEKHGILLPVVSLHVNYVKPAYYDEELSIKTYLKQPPSVRIKFDYEVFNQDEEMINHGNVTLVFVDAQTRKPRRAPNDFLEKIRPHFKK